MKDISPTYIYNLVDCEQCGCVFNKRRCKKDTDEYKNIIGFCPLCKSSLILEEYEYY